jgi:hypothetical protein
MGLVENHEVGAELCLVGVFCFPLFLKDPALCQWVTDQMVAFNRS